MPRGIEDPCDHDGGLCEWVSEDGMPDSEGGYEAWDLYCGKCYRWRDWGVDDRKESAMTVLSAMKTKAFAFTLTFDEEKWDCYHFESTDGKLGTLAFAERGERWCIGLFCAGHLAKEEALRKLAESESA